MPDAGYVERPIAGAQVGARIETEHVLEVIGAVFRAEDPLGRARVRLPIGGSRRGLEPLIWKEQST